MKRSFIDLQRNRLRPQAAAETGTLIVHVQKKWRLSLHV